MSAYTRAGPFDRFLFHACDPRVCVVLRLFVATILLIYLTIWWFDASLWFSDAGVLRNETAKQLDWTTRWSILFWLPSNALIVKTLLSVLSASCLMLWLGICSRTQAAILYVGLTSFQHRNLLICDGEDTVLRWLLFAMIFMPLDYCFALRRTGPVKAERRPLTDDRAGAWALRIVQLELTAIYLSTAWCKWQGETWRDGTALYYVSIMDDVFGRFWVPEFVFTTYWIVQTCTWAVLVGETILPFGLWIRPLRKPMILLGILLHLAIEYSMHLFLFEWIMLAGLLTFVRPEEWTWSNKNSSESPANITEGNPSTSEGQLAQSGV